MSTRITHPELLSLVRDLIAQGKTATLYITTDKNHSVVIGIDGGRIVALSSGLRHGEKAIPAIREMTEGNYRIESFAVPAHAHTLPPTQTILSLMQGEDSTAEEAPDPQVAAHAELPAASSPTMALPSEPLQPLPLAFDPKSAHDTLCQILCDYLGPICSMICDENEEQLGGVHNPRDLEVLIDLLAREIQEPSEAEEFTNRARERLEKMLALGDSG